MPENVKVSDVLDLNYSTGEKLDAEKFNAGDGKTSKYRLNDRNN